MVNTVSEEIHLCAPGDPTFRDKAAKEGAQVRGTLWLIIKGFAAANVRRLT